MSARGQQRRGALLDAAADLLGSVGPAAVTARAVAGAAGVPLAAVSYYFSSVEELLRLAAEQLFAGHLAAARSVVDGERGHLTCAHLLVLLWLDPLEGGPDPRRVRSLLSTLPAALDVPALAPQLQRFDDRLLGLVREVLVRDGRDATRARLLLATLDGLALARLCGVRVPRSRGPGRVSIPAPAADQGRLTATGLTAAGLLEDLAADLGLVLDDLAPAQNSRAVGSSRPDSAT